MKDPGEIAGVYLKFLLVFVSGWANVGCWKAM